MEIADEHREMSDDDMHLHLLGDNPLLGSTKYVADLMKFPESAWITDIPVPDNSELYGHVSGESFEVLSYITFRTGN